VTKTILLITAFLYVSFAVHFCLYNAYSIKAKEFPTTNSLPTFVETENSKIGFRIKYPENWTIEYANGNNNSLAASPEMFKGEFKLLKANKTSNDKYPTDSDKYQFFVKDINTNCGITTDCRLIEDKYLQSFVRDSIKLRGDEASIFDYIPSVAFLPPIKNLTDNFLESVKIGCFILPDNSSLADFINFYGSLYNDSYTGYSNLYCHSDVLGYPVECGHLFTSGENIEGIQGIQYKTLQFFIEKNHKVYIISYNALTSNYLKDIELLKVILRSLELT